MRTQLLCCVVFLSGTQVVQAQPWAAYPTDGTNPNNRQAVQRVNYPYGANPYGSYPYYPYGAAPGGVYYNPGARTYPYPQVPAMPAVRTTGKATASSETLQAPTPATPPPAAQPRGEPIVYTLEDKHSLTEAYGPRDDDRAVPFHRTHCEKFWVNADYIMAFLRPGQLNGPLLTIGSAADPFPQGALGQPSTSVLFGNELNFNRFDGFRAEAGAWINNCNSVAVEGGGFYLFPRTTQFTAASDSTGNPMLARPFFSVLAGRQGSLFTSFPATQPAPGVFIPALIAGSTTIDAKSELAGFETNVSLHSYRGSCVHASALAGFRFVRLAENLRIRDNVTALQPGTLFFNGAALNAGDSISDEDSFSTVNQFYGLQLGGRLRFEGNWFFVDTYGKVGLGATDERVNIAGSTTAFTGGGSQTATGGLLAVGSNIGQYSRTVFGVVPELGINVGVEATKNVRLRLGYSTLLWNDVVRPGRQFDSNVNTELVPSLTTGSAVTGPTQPSFGFNSEFLWVHIFNFGVEFHY